MFSLLLISGFLCKNIDVDILTLIHVSRKGRKKKKDRNEMERESTVLTSRSVNFRRADVSYQDNGNT